MLDIFGLQLECVDSHQLKTYHFKYTTYHLFFTNAKVDVFSNICSVGFLADSIIQLFLILINTFINILTIFH